MSTLEVIDAVQRALEKEGILQTVRAQLRSKVLRIISGGSDYSPTPTKVSEYASSREGQLILYLVKDFLRFMQLRETLAVFEAESGSENIPEPNREDLAKELYTPIHELEENLLASLFRRAAAPASSSVTDYTAQEKPSSPVYTKSNPSSFDVKFDSDVSMAKTGLSIAPRDEGKSRESTAASNCEEKRMRYSHINDEEDALDEIDGEGDDEYFSQLDADVGEMRPNHDAKVSDVKDDYDDDADQNKPCGDSTPAGKGSTLDVSSSFEAESSHGSAFGKKLGPDDRYFEATCSPSQRDAVSSTLPTFEEDVGEDLGNDQAEGKEADQKRLPLPADKDGLDWDGRQRMDKSERNGLEEVGTDDVPEHMSENSVNSREDTKFVTDHDLKVNEPSDARFPGSGAGRGVLGARVVAVGSSARQHGDSDSSSDSEHRVEVPSAETGPARANISRLSQGSTSRATMGWHPENSRIECKELSSEEDPVSDSPPTVSFARPTRSNRAGTQRRENFALQQDMEVDDVSDEDVSPMPSAAGFKNNQSGEEELSVAASEESSADERSSKDSSFERDGDQGSEQVEADPHAGGATAPKSAFSSPPRKGKFDDGENASSPSSAALRHEPDTEAEGVVSDDSSAVSKQESRREDGQGQEQQDQKDLKDNEYEEDEYADSDFEDDDAAGVTGREAANHSNDSEAVAELDDDEVMSVEEEDDLSVGEESEESDYYGLNDKAARGGPSMARSQSGALPEVAAARRGGLGGGAGSDVPQPTRKTNFDAILNDGDDEDDDDDFNYKQDSSPPVPAPAIASRMQEIDEQLAKMEHKDSTGELAQLRAKHDERAVSQESSVASENLDDMEFSTGGGDESDESF